MQPLFSKLKMPNPLESRIYTRSASVLLFSSLSFPCFLRGNCPKQIASKVMFFQTTSWKDERGNCFAHRAPCTWQTRFWKLIDNICPGRRCIFAHSQGLVKQWLKCMTSWCDKRTVVILLQQRSHSFTFQAEEEMWGLGSLRDFFSNLMKAHLGSPRISGMFGPKQESSTDYAGGYFPLQHLFIRHRYAPFLDAQQGLGEHRMRRYFCSILGTPSRRAYCSISTGHKGLTTVFSECLQYSFISMVLSCH